MFEYLALQARHVPARSDGAVTELLASQPGVLVALVPTGVATDGQTWVLFDASSPDDAVGARVLSLYQEDVLTAPAPTQISGVRFYHGLVFADLTDGIGNTPPFTAVFALLPSTDAIDMSSLITDAYTNGFLLGVAGANQVTPVKQGAGLLAGFFADADFGAGNRFTLLDSSDPSGETGRILFSYDSATPNLALQGAPVRFYNGLVAVSAGAPVVRVVYR